ncbi:hypothetical protein C2845_PM08G12460 [Panicum miliaceum]|uniref:Uncharacterized protein n=1 Tax=Panicum miliaceum TaxID=4540 RepID=A0A3L6R6T2_PANMI|nr:hypothetical protein C2845_PM08G12460 [Panicum miliaceum]
MGIFPSDKIELVRPNRGTIPTQSNAVASPSRLFLSVSFFLSSSSSRRTAVPPLPAKSTFIKTKSAASLTPPPYHLHSPPLLPRNRNLHGRELKISATRPPLPPALALTVADHLPAIVLIV